MGGKCSGKKTESLLSMDSVFFQSKKSEDLFFLKSISPLCLGLCFFSGLKCSDYFRTNFLFFAGARVLDTH